MTTNVELTRIGLPAACTENALSLPDGLTFDEWAAIGATLTRMNRSVMWWIGDWVNYGESVYGETYAQAIDVTGYDYSTVSTASWVARKIEPSRRRENVAWGVHREVAALEPNEQDRLLGLAEGDSLTVRAVRNLAAGKPAQTPKEPDDTEPWMDYNSPERLRPIGLEFAPEWQVRNSQTRMRGEKEGMPREALWFREPVRVIHDYAMRIRDVKAGATVDEPGAEWMAHCQEAISKYYNSRIHREAWLNIPDPIDDFDDDGNLP